MGLISMPEDKNKNLAQTFRAQQQKIIDEGIPSLKIDAKRVEFESQNRQSQNRIDVTHNVGYQTERQHPQPPQMIVKSSSMASLQKVGFHIKLPQITVNDYSKELVTIRDQLKSREDLLKKQDQTYYIFKHGMLTSRKNSPEQTKGFQSGIITRYDEPLIINSDSNSIRQPPLSMKRNEQFMSRQPKGGQTDSGNKADSLEKQIKSPDRIKRIDNTSPENFPKRKNKPIIFEKLTSDQGTSKMMTESDKLQDNSASKISNTMSLAQNLNPTDTSHILAIDAENILNGKQPQIGQKRRVFSNQRLQQEVLRPLMQDSLREMQSIRIPKLQGTIGSDVNTSHIKNEPPQPASEQQSQLDLSGQLNTVNSTIIIKVSNPTQLVDVKHFCHQIKTNDLMIQSHATKLFNHNEQKQRSQQVQIQYINPNQKPNSSLEQVSTEPNSKIINEQSIEEDKDDIENYQRSQEQPHFVATKNQMNVDNITYIENFFNFKVDPEDLLSYFDENQLDVEALSKDELKKVLLDYIKQRQEEKQRNKIEEKQRQVQQIRDQNRHQKFIKEEMAKLKIKQQKEQKNAKEIEIFEEIFKKYTIEQQRVQETQDIKKQEKLEQKQKSKKTQPQLHFQQIKEEQDQIHKKQIENYVKENILQKWIFRKLNQCIDLLDKGMDKVDALSKVCPEGTFMEIQKNSYQWKNNKVKKQKKVQKYQMKEESYGYNQNNNQNIQNGQDQDNRPGSQYQSNNDINIVLKIGPQNQLKNRGKSPNTLQKDALNFSQEDGTSTLNQRNDSKGNSQEGDRYSDRGGKLNNKSQFKTGSRGARQRKNGKIVINDNGQKDLNENGISRPNSVSDSLQGSREQKRQNGGDNINITRSQKQNANTKRVIQKLLPNQSQQQLNLQKAQSESHNKDDGIDLSQIPSMSQSNSQQFQSFATEKSLLALQQQSSLNEGQNKGKAGNTGGQNSNKLNQKDLTVKTDRRLNQNLKNERDIIMEHDLEQSIEDKSDLAGGLGGSADQSEMKSMALFRNNDDLIRTEDQSPSKGSDSNRKLPQRQKNNNKGGVGVDSENNYTQNSNNQQEKQSFESMNSNNLQMNNGEFKSPFQNEKIRVNYNRDGEILSPIQGGENRVNLTEEDENISNYSNRSIGRKDIKSRDAIMMNKYKEKQAQSSRNQDMKPSNLKDRLSKSLNKKINEQQSEQSNDQTKSNIPGQSSKESNRTEVESTIKTGGTGSVMKILAQGVRKTTKKGKNESVQGSDSKRKSALSQIKDVGENTPKNGLSKKSTFKVAKVGTNKLQQNKLEADTLKRQNSIEERISEDSRDDIRIDISEKEVNTVKDNCFSLISEKLFDLSPRDRIENIKIAATLELLDYDKIVSIGLQYNERRNNYEEMIDKIKAYLRGHEKQNAGIKINQKTFNDLKKRLMPDPNISPIDFINVLKTGVQSRRDSKSTRNTFQDQVESLVRKSIKDMNDPAQEEKMEDNQIQELNRIKCDEILSNIFDQDQDFKYFKGRLKEYRMKFGQQTQFVESVNDVEDQDRRDYATFDRLEAYKKHHDKMKEVSQKVKKFENTKGFIKDVPALAAEGKNNNGVQDMGSYMITIEGQGDKPDQQFSLNQLADDVLRTFLEVKKKNKRLENQGEKRIAQEKKAQDDKISSNPTTTNQSIQDNSLNTTKILKKYRLNLEEKRRLESLTDFERQERKYGLMAKNDPDYLNPVLSQRYIERIQLSTNIDHNLHLPNIKLGNNSFRKHQSQNNL
ncbi:UNKNOWN [Stylonychia lemnae]|uniref:Uncharacterized protein n=1 Tax=Stylonychia lemnae TaxID=5949 RepID=A0A078AUA7_STYLE|nr:UNKNOWN [Stylonychia lemnae]|eukprot:CDW85581.1 UNKNOWN [Stylonychia lemnae]